MTDALIRTLISNAKSPGTVLWILDVSLTLGRLQTKEEKSTNQWAFSPTRRRTGGWGWSVREGGVSEGWAGPVFRVSMKIRFGAEGEGGCVLGGAPTSPRIKRPVQTLVLGADSEVCMHGWIDGEWGSNLPWPWPGALVRIRQGPSRARDQGRWLGLRGF